MVLDYSQKGFVALTSAIIIAAILIVVTIAISFSSFFSRFNIADTEYKKISLGLAESCAEYAIATWAGNNSYTGGDSHSIGSSLCQVGSVDIVSGELIVQSSATYQKSTIFIEVKVNPTTFDILGWKEVTNF